MYLAHQMSSLSTCIAELLRVKGLLTTRPVGTDIEPPSNKSYEGMRMDGLASNETSDRSSEKQQTKQQLPWWDPDDEGVWIPHGWNEKRPEFWLDYEKIASEKKKEDGLDSAKKTKTA
ncbi:unnamed protein product [Prorocentrum cordatum]|uniref:WW domain-containing protein n=1 Tax=Prorocentrum cordatum TaxID=2364126 RepID=A0ABN9TIU1_9DINO|nr:unnamed protein product [Polarella glacialis]